MTEQPYAEPARFMIHFDEICLKGLNRSFFEDILVANIKAAINQIGKNRLKFLHDRILLEVRDPSLKEQVLEALGRVPGICDYSPIMVVPSQMEELCSAAVEIAKTFKGTFRVTVKRSDKNFPIQSPEIARRAGEAVFTTLNLPVDLHNPEHHVWINVQAKESYVYGEKYVGMGGLPVGSSGKLVCFVSGGIDSPVAGYKMFRRGCTVIFVHFHNHHEGEQDVKDKVQSLVQTLSRYQPFTKLYLVPFGELQRALIGYVPSEMRMVSYRRMMFRIGSHIRRKESAKGYVTGDAVGQVASQTMDNLRAIHAVADYPVLSPLIGDSKQEIISVARQIDTYDLSILPYADCCSFLVDKHPDTSIDLDELNEIEEPIPVDELIRPCLEQTELYRFQFGKLLEVKPAFKDSFLESLS